VPCGVPGTMAGGLWSQVLLAMNRPDTKKLRKNLQALWKKNCGNIKVHYLIAFVQFGNVIHVSCS